MTGWGQERIVAAGHRATKQVHDLAGAATGVLDRKGVAGPVRRLVESVLAHE